MAQHTDQPIRTLEDTDASVLGSKVVPPYFFGVYDKFQHVGSDPFASDGWINHCKSLMVQWNSPLSKIKLMIKTLIKKILGLNTVETGIVKYIESMLECQETISILDIGGGFGDNFFHIEKALGSSSKRVKYVVVDNQVQCDLGSEFYRGKNKNITFKNQIPSENFDLIIIIGTLQYIENWKEFIREVITKSINSVFISRTPINIGGPTFVTIQSICPAFGSSSLQKIGESNLNVFNEEDLHLEFEKNGFSLLKSIIVRDYSENFRRLPSGYQSIKYIDKYFVKEN
jgi:putative methyltransferase (TIGR04325 family)